MASVSPSLPATSWPPQRRRQAALAALCGGLLLALLFQWASARSGGGWEALLQVGASSPAGAPIQRELGPVPVHPGLGHDGQQSYLIARDPFGRAGLSAFLDNASYRHRRYVQPALAGGFGTFSPRMTLAGLVVLGAVGLGLAAAAVVAAAPTATLRRWGLVGVLTNLGLYDSLKLTTPDALAFGFAAAGLALWARGRKWAAVAMFCCAGLTKETYLLVPLGLAGYLWRRDRRAASTIGAVPVVVVAGWTLAVFSVFGTGEATGDNLTPPFVGIAGAARVWAALDLYDMAFLSIALLVGSAVAVAAARNRLLSWTTLPWLALAILSSSRVWIGDGLRAFAPLWLAVAVGVGVLFDRRLTGRPCRTDTSVSSAVAASP